MEIDHTAQDSRAYGGVVQFSLAKYNCFDSKRFETLFGEVVVRFDLEGMCLDPLFPTHAKTMLPKTRFFFTRERMDGGRGL